VIDLGVSKIALIGAVALVFIGPEKLPKLARTLGAMVGRAQRYVADVKAEVNRSMDLEELKKMKETVESAARDVETTVHTASTDFEKDWQSATAGLDTVSYTPEVVYPEYALPKKKWRIKQGAAPQWYKARHGIRSKALSGAARVARFRPQRLG
jgi:sec-independent protein translocase protein TatB